MPTPDIEPCGWECIACGVAPVGCTACIPVNSYLLYVGSVTINTVTKA